MDDVPVPEIVELSPPSRRTSPRFGGSPRGFARILRATLLVSIVLIGAGAVLRWGPFEDATAERASGASPAIVASSSPAAVVLAAALLHAWERPYEVAPGPDDLGSGSLRIANGSLTVRKDPDPAYATSSVAASGADSLIVTATADTPGCEPGAVGTYRVAFEGKDTVLTLTASGPDACPAREVMLAGPWVRADFPPPVAGGLALAPGRYRTTVFDPLSVPGSPHRLSYALPAGWEVADDASSAMLHRVPDPSTGDAGPDPFISVMTRPAVTLDYTGGATCDQIPPEARGVGHGRADIVRAITTRPGVVSTRPEALTIGGFEGTMLDLRMATSWTRGCQTAEGPMRAVALLEEQGSKSGPFMGLSADHPLRLILLDLGDRGALAVVASSPRPAPFAELVAAVMPIIESFEFVPAPN